MPNQDVSAVKEAFARRAAQMGGGGAAAPQGAPMGNPMMQMAQARGQGATNGQGGAEGEAMFILKVLAKRLEQLPPHKPEKMMQQGTNPRPANA